MLKITEKRKRGNEKEEKKEISESWMMLEIVEKREEIEK